MSPPIIVIGGHRSGTSATAAAVRMLGLQLGHILDSHDEPRPLQRFHEKYLQGVGAAWHDPAPFLAEINTSAGRLKCFRSIFEAASGRFAQTFDYRRSPVGLWLLSKIRRGKPWGWKEPRTTLFASVWLELFPEARVLHIVRHPLHAGLSIQRRELRFRAAGNTPNGSLHDIQTCVRLALIYAEAGAAAGKHASHYKRVKFEDLQANPPAVLESIGSFCNLGFTNRELNAAAQTIRARPAGHQDSADETIRRLISDHPIAAELGYA